MSLEGVKLSGKLKLRTDLFHHTHEVWGPCSYKSPRVWALYASVRGSYTMLYTIYRFFALPDDHFGHKNVVITGNVPKPDRENKNAFW